MTRDELNSFSLSLFKSEVLGVKLIDIVDTSSDYTHININDGNDIPKPLVVKLTIPEFSDIKREDLEKIFLNVTDEDVSNANNNDHKIKVFKDSVISILMKTGVHGLTEEDYFNMTKFLCRIIKGQTWTGKDIDDVKEKYYASIAEINKMIQEELEYMEV